MDKSGHHHVSRMNLSGLTGFSLGALLGICFVIFGWNMMYLNKYDVVGEREPVAELLQGNLSSDSRDDSVAKGLYQKVRVACWILTTAKYHASRARRVQQTWGKRCHKLLFVTDANDKNLPVLNYGGPADYRHLLQKTRTAFDKIYKEDVEKYDWFLKADDDTYVIMENLRYLLSRYDPEEPGFFGLHLRTERKKEDFFSGGAGYVVSREALRRFGRRSRGQCPEIIGPEDIYFSQCMLKLGVKMLESRDALNRSRFHAYTPHRHVNGLFDDWFRNLDTHGAKHGAASMSDYAISFHYVSPAEMYSLEYLVYQLRPYGINWNPVQNTSKPDT